MICLLLLAITGMKLKLLQVKTLVITMYNRNRLYKLLHESGTETVYIKTTK